jgi:predicted DNA-binding transcriptional regulator AlpA
MRNEPGATMHRKTAPSSTELPDEALIREAVVLSMIPQGRAQMRKGVANKTFPQPVRFRTSGGRIVLAWVMGEIRAYVRALVKARDQELAAAKARALEELDSAPGGRARPWEREADRSEPVT